VDTALVLDRVLAGSPDLLAPAGREE